MEALALRTADDIARSLIDYHIGLTPRTTDLTPGSVITAMLESVALELSRLEVSIAQKTNEAIEQSAYLTFGFVRKQPQNAAGNAIFSFSGGPGTIAIPAGTRIGVPGAPLRQYETVSAVTVELIGDPSDPIDTTVPIIAIAAGAAGNTPERTITDLHGTVPGVVSVSNPKALFSGADMETDAERRDRFQQFVRSIQRGTKDAIIAGAKSTRILDDFGYELDAVRKMNTVENDPTQPNEATGTNICHPGTPNPDNPKPGTIWLFVSNGSGPTSQELLDACDAVIQGTEDVTTTPSTLVPGFKAAAIECHVFAAVDVPIPVQVEYELDLGFVPEVVTPGIELAIKNYFAGLDVGDDMRIEALKRQIALVHGVLDFHLVAPVVNYRTRYKELCQPEIIGIDVVDFDEI